MKYQLVTRCQWSGTDTYHEIEGDFKSEEEALKAFGGDDAAWQQAIEDHEPSYSIEEFDEDDY